MVLGSKYEALASREVFNASVRHVKSTVSLADRIDAGENLADNINSLLDEKVIQQDDIQSLVSMLLLDKFSYYSASKNMTGSIQDFSSIQSTVSNWNAFDIVIVYYHPDMGILTVNPKNPAHVQRIDRINKTELIVAYVGCNGKNFDKDLAQKACNSLLSLYEGEKPKAIAAFEKGQCVYKTPAEPKAPKAKAATKAQPKAKAAKKGKVTQSKAAPDVAESANLAMPAPKPGVRMTPRYGVTVANELFHNGNVEAWKRIIRSYNLKHPDLSVLVYYDGERIVDINALFKWGKVKHGSVIEFAVAGENISDVAKLQRYLAQGASSMFEAFLHGPVNGVLNLF